MALMNTMKKSNYLENIINAKRGAINLQIVFTDIVDYSKRKSTIQKKVIDNFTKLSQEALESTSQQYIKYAQENDLNFATDLIKIPTGDGLAVIFPFEGLQSAHLEFAKIFLEKIHEHNKIQICDRFIEPGWCNCHDNFNIRVGISEGKGIIYKDLNENYNVAGNVINMASRVMQLSDPNSILLTEEAYKNLIDMTLDTDIEDSFKEFVNIKIKHGIRLNIYQYCLESDYINVNIPKKINKELMVKDFEKKLSAFMPFPIPDDNEDTEENNLEKMQIFLDGMIGLKEILTSKDIKSVQPTIQIEGEKEE